MSEKLTKGIVLKTIDFQDNDKIVTVYSEKYGKISFVALGVKKNSSKNMYSLNTFSICDFEIFKSRTANGLSKLKTGHLINSNINLSKIFNNYLFASAIISIVLKENQFNEKNFKVFKMLEISISNIANNKNPFSNIVWFMFYILKFLGGNWNLSKCYRCNKKNFIYRKFDFKDYGLVCVNCFDHIKDEKQNSEFIDFLIKADKNNFSSIITEPLNVSYEIILLKILLIYIRDEIGINSLAIDEILLKPIYSKYEFAEYSHNVLTK